jgi:hypothetical protein
VVTARTPDEASLPELEKRLVRMFEDGDVTASVSATTAAPGSRCATNFQTLHYIYERDKYARRILS